MVMHCVDGDSEPRRSTKKIEIEILTSIDMETTKWVEVNVHKADSEEWHFEVFAANTKVRLCVGRFQVCSFGPVELRYDASKLVGPSQRTKDLATASRDNFGEPAGELTPFFKFEMANTNQGNGWLHLADIAVCEVRVSLTSIVLFTSTNPLPRITRFPPGVNSLPLCNQTGANSMGACGDRLLFRCLTIQLWNALARYRV